MDYTIDEVMQYIEEEDAKFIRLAFCDAYGVQKNISVMPGQIVKAFNEGIAVNAKEIAGYKDCPYGFLYLKPDASTLSGTMMSSRKPGPESGRCQSISSRRKSR